MHDVLAVRTANTILYCRHWQRTVDFYRHGLRLSVTFESEWFVEFRLSEDARLSVADERRASIKSAGGAGVTITLQVLNADAARRALSERGLAPGPVKDHPWGARVFYITDPEGHRLELWSPE